MSDLIPERNGPLTDLIEHLRNAEPGVGRRLEADHQELRLQSFGSGRVGLRVLLEVRPKIGVTVELVESQVRRVEGRWALDIVERSPGSPEQSAALFADLVLRLREAPAGTAPLQVESALKAWRAAFSGRSDLLEKSEILGLFGELIIMKEMLLEGLDAHSVVTAWTGPDKEDHDFTFAGRFQIEVKATTPHSERLKINNEHQLEAKDVPLYLACVRAAIVPEGSATTTLTLLVQELSDKIGLDGTRHLFRQKLESLGFDRFDVRYGDIHLELTSTALYVVQGSMPRVTPRDLRTGVTQVSYQILTSDLGAFQLAVRPWSNAQGGGE